MKSHYNNNTNITHTPVCACVWMDLGLKRSVHSNLCANKRQKVNSLAIKLMWET